MTQPDYGQLRASDAERERAIDVLRAGFAEGRLSQGEHAERVGRVQVSRTYGDLAELTGDLPVGPLGGLPPPPAPAYPPVPPSPADPPAVAHQPGPPLVARRQRDALAVISLAVALLAVPLPPAAFAAFGLGLASLFRIRATGMLGRNFATAGLALGALGIAIYIALTVASRGG
jgi:Domain of unknown function (DUF1707)